MSSKRLTADDCWRGRLCTWVHTPRGGYGFSVPVPATIVRRSGQSHAIIEASLRDGSTVGRRVAIANLYDVSVDVVKYMP